MPSLERYSVMYWRVGKGRALYSTVKWEVLTASPTSPLILLRWRLWPWGFPLGGSCSGLGQQLSVLPWLPGGMSW